MIIIVASILAVLTVPLTGRSLAPLAKLPLRHVWLIWLSIGSQTVIVVIPGFPDWLGRPVHIATFGLAAVFMWVNRNLPGVLLVALEAALNVAGSAANEVTPFTRPTR